MGPAVKNNKVKKPAMAGLYIHIPFCRRKCAYCDFYSVERGEQTVIQRYLSALCREITLRGEARIPAHTVETIYFGGGTPSLLAPDQLVSILMHIDKYYAISDKPEITLEANPGTLSDDMLRDFREAGINRISIGIQSFHDHELKQLGRLHSAEQAEAAVMLARTAGFEQIGIDLIYGLPGQSIKTHGLNLKKAVSLNPHHISAYSLTWNTSTPLGIKIETGKLARPDDASVSAMFRITHSILSDAGYEHYEISNFARPGYRCLHNEGYWTGKSYLGMGPSAHSFLYNERFWNISDVNKYISVLSHNHLPVEEREVLSPEQMKIENICLGLRRKEGIPLDMVQDKEGPVGIFIQSGLAAVSKGFLSLTPRGLCVADELTLRLID
jgi:oxygen-independent coproporphyrinogen-3 oxidase